MSDKIEQIQAVQCATLDVLLKNAQVILQQTEDLAKREELLRQRITEQNLAASKLDAMEARIIRVQNVVVVAEKELIQCINSIPALAGEAALSGIDVSELIATFENALKDEGVVFDETGVAVGFGEPALIGDAAASQN